MPSAASIAEQWIADLQDPKADFFKAMLDIITYASNREGFNYGATSAGKKWGCGGVAPIAGVPPLYPVLI